MILGGVEAGGTKWVCAVVDDDGREAITSFPTTTPVETIDRAVSFFLEQASPPARIGVGAFGPIDLRPNSPSYGHITTTPKPGWAHTDVVSMLRQGLDVPIAFDTDVNAAALGEWRWGAGSGLETFCYVTVGTGIGGGVIANGRILYGLLHPEFGHMRIPHDLARDPFAGVCPYHGDCLEGLASGESIRQRWGSPAEELDSDEAWDLEAGYLALGLANVVSTLMPERIVIGGGVLERRGLLPLVRSKLMDIIRGYLDIPALTEPAAMDDYLVAPGLGRRSGVMGAIELARIGAARVADSLDAHPLDLKL